MTSKLQEELQMHPRIEQLSVGDKAVSKRTVTKELIKKMADISDDFNPIHLDESYAAKTQFKKCIAHGLFCIGLISKIIGMELPGEGSVFVNEKLNYRNPVFVGDEITASIEILSIEKKKSLVEVGICCINQNKQIVMDGTSLLKLI